MLSEIAGALFVIASLLVVAGSSELEKVKDREEAERIRKMIRAELPYQRFPVESEAMRADRW